MGQIFQNMGHLGSKYIYIYIDISIWMSPGLTVEGCAIAKPLLSRVFS